MGEDPADPDVGEQHREVPEPGPAGRGAGGGERAGSYTSSGSSGGGYGSGGNYAGSRANTSSGGYAQQAPANDYADQGITDEDIPF